MRHTEIINRLELSLIETEYALADAQLSQCEMASENARNAALRRANAAIRLALQALTDSAAQTLLPDLNAFH